MLNTNQKKLQALVEGDSLSRAVIFNETIFTYEDFYIRISKLEQCLKKMGINENSRVGILLGNSPEFIVSLLALAKLGSGCVLFSTYFKQYELERYIKDSEIRFMISGSDFDENLSNLSFKTFFNREIPGEGRFGAIKISNFYHPIASYHKNDFSNGEQDEFILQFTSGVNGESKIVSRSYSNVLDELINYSYETSFKSCDSVICLTPLFHAYGLVNGMLPTFFNKGTLILMKEFVPRNFLKLVVEHKPTISIGVPFLYGILNQTYYQDEVNLNFFRFCFSAGGKLEKKTAMKFAERYQVNINQLYGSTETGVISFNKPEISNAKFESVGKAVKGRTIDIVDDADRVLAPFQEGNIRVKSKGTAKGYIKQESLNKSVFKGSYYYTGDIGKKDEEGNLYITGRTRTFINVASMKVDPAEVENVLSLMSYVKESVVLGVHHEISGEVIKAFVILNVPTTKYNIIQFCKKRLADYKVPRKIEIVKELPRNSMGKILKKYLINCN